LTIESDRRAVLKESTAFARQDGTGIGPTAGKVFPSRNPYRMGRAIDVKGMEKEWRTDNIDRWIPSYRE
jgi:hypothetical protein